MNRLFKLIYIPILGSFQDGGLRHNKPVNLALWGSRQIWTSTIVVDVVLSLGTGTEDDPRSPKAPRFRHVLNDGFIPRLCRAFMSLLDGENTWKELINRLDEDLKADYFRFNVSLSGPEPRLDDVHQMGQLRKCVQLQPNGLKNRVKTASALLSAAFFFELQVIPTFHAGLYLCQGLIRCRNDSNAIKKS